MRPIGADEEAELAAMVQGFLLHQARAAREQGRPLGRGVHAKGVCLKGVLQVFDLYDGRPRAIAERLSHGIFSRPCTLPATVRFSNASATSDRDCTGDVRGLAFQVEIPQFRSGLPAHHDFSLQSAPTLPFNDLHELALFTKVFTAASQAVALGTLPFREQLIFARIMRDVMHQKRQQLLAYQKLRYWSAAPFRHGPREIVKYSVWSASTNLVQPIDASNPNALRDELLRHVNEDERMSTFEFGVQFLEAQRMTYQGQARDSHFWIENAAVEWPEAESPFHTVARLTLLCHSELDATACESLRIDTSVKCLPESEPVGEMNRARSRIVAASQFARSAAK